MGNAEHCDSELDIDDSILPRQRKLPMSSDESVLPHYHQTPKEMYYVIYFEAYGYVKSGQNGLADFPTVCAAIKR